MRIFIWVVLTAALVWALSMLMGGGKPSTEKKPSRPWYARVKSGKPLRDDRDAKVYKTVVIGGKTWMAENLNYQTPRGSWCYRNNDSNCVKYGRLYNWKTAKSACPSGWHLPTVDEWDDLGKAAGSQRDTYNGLINWGGAGKNLKASSGWDSYNTGRKTERRGARSADGQRTYMADEPNKSGDGINRYGFSALPGGNRRPDDYFFTVGTDGTWWTATTSRNKGSAGTMSMSHRTDDLDEATSPKDYGFSVRCVLGEGDAADGQSEEDDEIYERNEKEQAEQAEQQIAIDSSYFTDERDRKKYRAVMIGGKRWMAENLSYKTPDSWCYDGMIDSCAKYGRLYRWTSASSAACPAGWHLPFREDWYGLAQAVGGKQRRAGWKGTIDWDGVSKKLKAKSGWNDHDGNSGNGTDNYGFHAMPGGYYSGAFRGIGNRGEWWSATWDDSGVFYARLYNGSNELSEHYDDKTGNRSVRCVETSSADLAKMKHEEELMRQRAEQLRNEELQRQKEEEQQRKREEEQRKKEEEQRKKETAQKIEKATAVFTDLRDGKKYRSVKIGGKTWMAENLNYTTPSGSWCYDNQASNCAKYGRLYNWKTAKTACPEGWHLSTRHDWDWLSQASVSEKKSNGGSIYWHGSGAKLRNKKGWNEFQGKSGDGTDDFGFAALPGGARNYRNGGSFDNLGYYGYWWTATEGNSGFANHRNMGYTLDYVEERNQDVDYGFSVRCVADN